MKSFFLLLILIIFGNSLLSAQESDDRKKIFPINEFTFSLNRTAVADENTQDRFGFGIGLYYVFFNQKRCNLITGLEYNRNVQFKKTMYAGHYGNDYNVTYKINNFGLPVCFRVNMGQKIKFFLETGAFVDLPVNYEVNLGISGGVGLRIPVKKHEILLKGDYKWGMRAIYSYQDSIYNRYWRFIIGFKLNL